MNIKKAAFEMEPLPHGLKHFVKIFEIYSFISFLSSFNWKLGQRMFFTCLKSVFCLLCSNLFLSQIRFWEISL